jgi:O-antigen ligase
MSLLVLASVATMTIWTTDARFERSYQCGTLAMAGWACWRGVKPWAWAFFVPLALLGAWGFAQLLLGATEYRHATLDGAYRYTSYAATAIVAYATVPDRRAIEIVLRWFVAFGCLVAVLGVLTYHSSPGRILWLWKAPYPDTWGPFLSRNNFAQFLELCFPAALWLASGRGDRWIAVMAALVIFVPGLLSASRAGAALLLSELAVAAIWMGAGQRRWVALISACGLALGAWMGAGTLVDRLMHSELLAERGDLYRSSWQMIQARPWIGFGIGTYASVYPEFANFDSGYMIEHAHNDWLEWAAEGGLGFTAIWVWILTRTLSKARQLWMIGIAAVFAHAIVDFPTARTGISAWLFLLIGMAEAGIHFSSGPWPQFRPVEKVKEK